MRETNGEKHTHGFLHLFTISTRNDMRVSQGKNTLVNNNKPMICCFLKSHFYPDRLTDSITLDKIGSKITAYSQPQD